MEINPLISIVLPVRDTAPYLESCLDSICNQAYVNWELIAVNDASSDSSLNILNAYAEKDDRIKVLNNPNPGLLNALRFGYAKTNGSHIHRMDSDDKMPDYKLQLMLQKWLEHGKGSVITGATEYFTDEGELGDGFKRYDRWLRNVSKTNTHAVEIYRECVVPSNCWLVHREDFDKIGGFEHDTMPEDYDLSFRFYQGNLKIIGIDDVLHYWRDRSDRISRTREEYRDNRFFHLKFRYFMNVDRESHRPLVLWGAGKNGKDLVKLFKEVEPLLHWICDNPNKIGKDIYEIRLQSVDSILELNEPQILIAVSSPDEQLEIEKFLAEIGKIAGKDFWFFS